jgi:Rrf2 family protein
MKFSRSISYALQAVLQLAASGTKAPVPCSQLAAEGSMPERFLLQILRHLVAHGILDSTRGIEGGYLLERAPGEISLLEVIEAVEGPLVIALPMVDGLPARSKEFLKQALSDLTAEARLELGDITLDQLLPARRRQAAKRRAKSSRASGSRKSPRGGGQRSRKKTGKKGAAGRK